MAGEPLPELEPPLLGSCLIHMLRRLPDPLVSCVKGGMQPRSHLISAQVLATEERARLYSMQLMLDLVAEANRGTLHHDICKCEQNAPQQVLQSLTVHWMVHAVM